MAKDPTTPNGQGPEEGKDYIAALKSGRAFNGAHRDAGKIIHLVPPFGFTSWDKALCGTSPGSRGNGWTKAMDHEAVNCPKCIRKGNPNE